MAIHVIMTASLIFCSKDDGIERHQHLEEFILSSVSL